MFGHNLTMQASTELTWLEQQQGVSQLGVADSIPDGRAPPDLRRQIRCQRLDISQRPSCRHGSQHHSIEQGQVLNPPALPSTTVRQAVEPGIGKSAKDSRLCGGLSILLTQYDSFEKLPDVSSTGAPPAV
jgi:hypothetical protein